MTVKLMIKSILCSLALATNVYAQDTQWVKNPDPTQPMTCSTLCVNNGLLPVRGGKIGASNESYSVCVRDVDGLRVGSEAPGAFAGQCDVGHDGQSKAGPVYSCLCSKTLIEAVK
jgi:hypothetical protein